MHYDMTGSVPPLTTWRLAIKKLVPAGTGKRVRRLKYYVVKTRFGTEALRNAVLDWQYGGYCGGRIFTRFPETGAHTTVSTDYYELERVFGPRGVPIRADDVLVDVGCGKGRILNYWLRSGLKNKLYGLELDPVFANKTAARLRHFEQVAIHEGDAIKNLPQDATLFFLYNPFALEVVERFKARVLEHYAHRLHTIRIVYYGCMYVEAFENDPNWNIQMLDHLPLFCRSALITPKL